MFPNNWERMNREELEIVYDVQWITPGNDDDKAKIIGIVDTPDTNLDWITFKSYLIQNSGNMHFTTDDIKISYIDSDDDLIPIDSELEFRECLKFSRTRARHGRQVIMKVNMLSNGGAKPKELKYRDDYLFKSSRPKLFCLKKRDLADKLPGKHSVSFEKGCGSDTGSIKEGAPEWFESYMAKFKAEIVQEVTTAVVAQMSNFSNVHGHNRRPLMQEYSKLHFPVVEKRKKKKKMHEEDSSDCTDGLQLYWDEKPELPRHLQKITKREKKFEKKLDVKLEKLESKSKKIIEKKSHLFADRVLDLKRSKAKKTLIGNRMMCGDLMMNAMPVEEYSYILHVQKGQIVVQTWEVINNGQFPWGEETELRFAWGSKSLVPITTVVKCPQLECGETGVVKVSLQAPMFVGNYESYWYFHHKGHRFGHWLGCTVIVDPEQKSETPDLAQATCSIAAVDLTMKCPPYARSLSAERLSLLENSPKKLEELAEHAAEIRKLENSSGQFEKLIETEMAELNIESKDLNDAKDKDADYANASSSDEMSIISGTLSIEDTEPSEEFVVIPMPPCFNFDKPIDSVSLPVTQPITVEIPEAANEPIVQESDNNNNMELKPFPELPMFLHENSALAESKSQESGYSEGENDENVCVNDKDIKQDSDAFTVYSKDSTGKSVPVARVLMSKDEADVSKQQPQSEESRNDETEHNSNSSSNEHSSNTHFYHHCYSGHGKHFCHPQHFVFEKKCEFPPQCNGHNSEFRHCPGPWNPSCGPNIFTEQPRSTKYSYAFQQAEKEKKTSSKSDSREFSPIAAAVNTLPETLVTGAVNVASSAISTARSVIDMLRPGHEDVVTGHWDRTVPPAYENSLRILDEMGFQNRALNISLLERYENNISKVVSQLLE